MVGSFENGAFEVYRGRGQQDPKGARIEKEKQAAVFYAYILIS